MKKIVNDWFIVVAPCFEEDFRYYSRAYKRIARKCKIPVSNFIIVTDKHIRNLARGHRREINKWAFKTIVDECLSNRVFNLTILAKDSMIDYVSLEYDISKTDIRKIITANSKPSILVRNSWTISTVVPKKTYVDEMSYIIQKEKEELFKK